MEPYIISMADVHGMVFYIVIVAGRTVTGGIREFTAISERKSAIVELHVLDVIILFALHP